MSMLDLRNMRAQAAWSEAASREAEVRATRPHPGSPSVTGCSAYAPSHARRSPSAFAWLPVWLGVAQLCVAHAYLTHRAAVFGKGKDGALSPLSVLALLPHLLSGVGLLRSSSSPACGASRAITASPTASCSDGAASRTSCPADCELVVDLTAEFPADPRIIATHRYRSLPVLNRHVPSDAEFEALLDELQRFRGGLYVHCGAGRGRSAMVVAALLVLRGAASDAREAERQLRAAAQRRAAARGAARDRRSLLRGAQRPRDS